MFTFRGGCDYSTSEVDTGQRWIDGKKIYRKTVQCTITSTTADQATPHGITNLSNIIGIKAYPKTADGSIRQIPSAYFGSLEWAADIIINSTNIIFELGSAFAQAHQGVCYVTLEYTKT